jgi:hypothetical protein
LQQAVTTNGQPKPSESTTPAPVESKRLQAESQSSVSEQSKPALSTTPPHCAKHGVPFVRFEKDGRAWWVQKAGDVWCRYQPSAKAS